MAGKIHAAVLGVDGQIELLSAVLAVDYDVRPSMVKRRFNRF